MGQERALGQGGRPGGVEEEANVRALFLALTSLSNSPGSSFSSFLPSFCTSLQADQAVGSS